MNPPEQAQVHSSRSISMKDKHKHNAPKRNNGYTSQVENHQVDQEWGMRMLIKISKSPTKTHLRSISSQFHIR